MSLTSDRWNLVLQDRSIQDKHLHLDCFRASFHGKYDLDRKNRRTNPQSFLVHLFFSNNGQEIFFLFWSFPISVAMKLSLLNHVVWNWEKWSYVCWMTPRFAALSFKRPACASDDAFTPVWKAFFALRLGISLEQSKQLHNCPMSWIIFLGFILNGS